MIPRIKSLQPIEDYRLAVVFDDGKRVIYDVKDDIQSLPGYGLLQETAGLFRNVRLDASRTCVYWNSEIDLPSDAIYEYGVPMTEAG